MEISGVPLLHWIVCIMLMTSAVSQTPVGFFPAKIILSGTKATSFYVGKTPTVTLSLAVLTNATVVPPGSCSGSRSTDSWVSVLEALTDLNVFRVTVTFNNTLTSCPVDEKPCLVETLQVSACENNAPMANLLIQAEIYMNTTFTGNVSDNATAIPNQAYEPLGPCPCNLTAGACDIGCCCDLECNSSVKQLFNGFCHTGVFGGNVTPSFDQLCSIQQENGTPDWFPFLCVQSSIDNTPFLGYFYQGSTVSVSQPLSFSVSSQSIVPGSSTVYKQGDAVLIDQNGNNQYFTIPQSSNGACQSSAPVAYLQNFMAICVSSLKTCADFLQTSLNVTVKDGKGGTIVPTTHFQKISVDNFITYSETPVSPVEQCLDVIISANYTFIWEVNFLIGINVTIFTADFSLTHQAQLTQRFKTDFLTSANINASVALSGNPGYQVGKPVLAINGSVPFTTAAFNLWKPVGDGSCSSATRTPVLYGQDSYSGCLLQVTNEDCTQLRESVTGLLKSLVPANYIAMRGNSSSNDLSEWVTIIYEESNATCSGDCAAENIMCLNVPVNMIIQILTAVTGAVEGIAQEEIVGAKISFSTVNVDCITSCNLSLPISSSVKFIKVPAQPSPRISSFQMNYTEYDCEKNDVCWNQLAYPLTQYYTAEPYHLTLAKGMILVFFFIVASVLGGPWNRILKAWNKTTL
ncbi:tectonic-2 [Pelodytes ibericus]